MTVNRFQGDLAIRITNNGASMTFKGGQPILDSGLENAVTISLMTKKGYWGNTLEKEESKKIGSNYSNQRTIIDTETINDYTDDAKIALKWMKDKNVVSEIFIKITNPYNDQMKSEIKLNPPGQDAMTLLFFKNGLNWINQATNPAHERF